MTWDDIFKSFELRHQYILDKLELDQYKLKEEIEKDKTSLDKKSSTSITERLKTITV